MTDKTPNTDAPSKPPVRFERSRIAISMFFGMVTVALCVMWVRSHYMYDDCVFRIGTSEVEWLITLRSFGGQVETSAVQYPNFTKRRNPITANSRVVPYDEWIEVLNRRARRGAAARTYTLGFSYHSLTDGGNLVLPYWFIVLGSALVPVLPWFRHRFSLRSMLIVTTLVAVVLGLVLQTSR